MQVKKCVPVVLLSGLAACASLPNSGPTGKQIEKSIANVSGAASPIQLVEVNDAAAIPQSSADQPERTLTQLPPPPTDMIGPGDVLDINIYEAGVTLFSGASATAVGQAGGSAGVQVQKLPPSRVDDNGDITVPYSGKLHVLGRTIGEVGDMVRRSMRGFSQNPQVLVTLSKAITNSVIVSGEVARPGRLVLETNRETLSDVVALAGGYRGNARDLLLRVTRRNENVDVRINDLVANPQLDVRAYPGDRLMVVSDPRSFSVLGASGRVEQLPFPRSKVSLAEAVATAGGANPGLGDPRAIFLFRYVADERGGESPVVYHLNMMNAGAYFLAQRFVMRDHDVLYFGNAAANQPSRLFQLISQLFTPIVTVTAAVNTVKTN